MPEPVAAVLDAARGLTIDPRERRWAHLSLCVLDAVFSIGARYSSTVRTCRAYADRAGLTALEPGEGTQVIGTPAEQPLDCLVDDIEAVGAERFAAEVLHNRQRTSPRGGVLKACAAHGYAVALVGAGVRTFADVSELFADAGRLAALEGELRRVPGNGANDVRLGYLWMLAGNDQMIKPDRRVLSWLGRVLGSMPTADAARTLLAAAARELGCTPWELDHAVWNAERGRRPTVDSDPAIRQLYRAHQGR